MQQNASFDLVMEGAIISTAPVPNDLIRFVLLAIPSVPYLEAVLLLRSNPDNAWESQQVAQRLYLSRAAARDLLVELEATGIARQAPDHDGSYRYGPQDVHLSQMIDRLAAEYARNLIGITNLIHSKTSQKAQQFADAFLFRKDR